MIPPALYSLDRYTDSSLRCLSGCTQGWCNDGPGCLSRANGLLGSSKTWTPKLSDLWGHGAGFYGLMSAETNQTGQDVGNPFGDWNFVWLAY
eukprot:COSAG06_NODE_20393_length_797_cov_1.995702_1_plen_91_part_10